MASTLSQAKELFKSADPDNAGVISRDDLKILMQEIGGETWAGDDNFNSMLEACGVAAGVAEIKYEGFLEQLLSDEDGKEGEAAKDEAPREEEAPKDEEATPAAAADSAAPSAQDLAEAEAIVGAVCARIVASMTVAEAKPEAPAADSPKADVSVGDPPKVEEESKQEEVKFESKLEEEAPAAAA